MTYFERPTEKDCVHWQQGMHWHQRHRGLGGTILSWLCILTGLNTPITGEDASEIFRVPDYIVSARLNALRSLLFTRRLESISLPRVCPGLIFWSKIVFFNKSVYKGVMPHLACFGWRLNSLRRAIFFYSYSFYVTIEWPFSVMFHTSRV